MEGLARSVDLRHFCSTAFAMLHWSLLFRFWACHFYVLSGWSGSYHSFRVLLWLLPRVAYEEAVAMSLGECCSFFSINFGYISDPLHDVNISSICLFGVEGWSAGALCGAPTPNGNKTTRTSSWRRSGVFVGSTLRFSYLVLVRCLTLNRFLFRGTTVLDKDLSKVVI